MKYFKLYVKELKKVCYNSLQHIKLNPDNLIENDQQLILVSVASECIAELISTNFHFNCFEELTDCIVKVFVNSRSSLEIRENISNSFQNLFQNDSLGQATDFVVKCICKQIIEVQFHVETIVYQTLKFVHFGAIDKNLPDKTNTLLSNRDKKLAKKMKQIERQLMETEASTNQEIRAKYERQILAELFSFTNKYFNNLENLLSMPKVNDFDRWHQSSLIAILDVIVHISDNIIAEFILYWINSLKSLSKLEYFSINLNIVSRLTFFKSIFTLMNTVDQNNIHHSHFDYFYDSFNELKFLDNEYSVENFQLYFECIDVMFLKNIRLLPNDCFEKFIARFEKLNYLINYLTNNFFPTLFFIRMLTMTMEHGAAEALTMLFVVKKCLKCRFAGQSISNIMDVDEEEFGNVALSNLKDNTLNSTSIININNHLRLIIDSLLAHKSINSYVKFFALNDFELTNKNHNQSMNQFIKKNGLNKEYCDQIRSYYSESGQFYKKICQIIN